MKTISKHATRVVARRSSAIALAVAAVLGHAAMAAEVSSSSVLEEIVVTAERRPINLQDVPASATVLTSKGLETQGIDNVVEIQQVAPSVAISTYNRGTFINIRGVGIAQSAPTSNPGVAYYIDGVYVPHETFIAHSFYDIDSIEVLRGPQGTLTGQNSTAGAIYVRTPAPSFEGFSAYVDQTAAEYDWFRTVGAVNVPFGDVVALRVAATYDTRDSFTDNIGSSSSNPGSSNLSSARASVLIKPTDWMSFDLRYEYFKLKSDYNAVKRRGDTVSSDPFTIEEDGISYLDQDGYRASAEARFDIGSSMQVRALTSRLKADSTDQADGDRADAALTPIAAPQPPAANQGRIGLTSTSFDTKVTELNLLSTGEQRLQWVTGLFYLTETIPVSVLRDNTHVVDFVVSNSTIRAEAENTSASVFGQVDMRFTDNWEAGLGARYSKDEQDYTRFALPGPNPGFGCFPCTTTAESSKTTGRFNVKRHVGEDTMFYTTLSRGYKAGGVNLDPRLGNFKPETNDVIELGVKTTILDGRLRINGDVFYSKYEGIQLSSLTSVGAGPLVPNTQGAGRATVKGLELEMMGNFGQFGFNFGMGLVNGEFSDNTTFITNSETNLNQSVPENTPLPFSPDITVSGGIQYDFVVGDMTLTPRLQAAYTDEQYATAFPGPNTTVASRTIADFRMTLIPIKNVRLEGFVTNLFDKTYIAAQVQAASSAAGGIMYGAPRQVGVRAKVSF